MKRLMVCAAAAAIALGQTPGGEFSGYYRAAPGAAPVNRWIHPDPPLTLSPPDAAGIVHLSLSIGAAPAIRFHAPGLNAIAQPDGSVDVFLDVALASYRSLIVPLVASACTIDTGGWSADKSGLYFCVPNDGGDPAVPLVWARAAVQVSTPDPAAAGSYIWK